MRKIHKLTSIIVIAAVAYSCGGDSSGLAEKKSQLKQYRTEVAELNNKIAKLEEEIAETDTTFKAEARDNVLVSSIQVEKRPFIHKIEVRGTVASRKNVQMSAETMGRVEKIYVKEGQEVKAGQLLIQLDADIIANNVSEVKTQLELAEAIFERQANLWEQKIGTEIQYLQAKNNKESLERRLETLQSQLSQYYVRAPFSGVVDNIPIKIGEMAQPGLPLVRIVNPNDMYIVADVSEAYLGKFGKGDLVEVQFPTHDLNYQRKILSVGKVINEQNRTFTVEVSLPSPDDFEFRPNQVAVLSLTDYINEEAISVPSRIIQSDGGGKYVFAVDSQQGRIVAKKVTVVPGKTFKSMTEIVAGLNGGEKIIDRGFREVNDGAEISLTTASL